MKRIRNLLLILLVIAAALYFTNPSQEAHQEKIIGKFKQENPLSGKLGMGDLFTKLVSYHNYYFLSVSRISLDDKLISVGLAGNVFVLGTTDINKYTKEVEDLVN